MRKLALARHLCQSKEELVPRIASWFRERLVSSLNVIKDDVLFDGISNVDLLGDETWIQNGPGEVHPTHTVLRKY